tara:strand:+ start:257 stop:763 length:507 start_codon:yes stop_codon:yes gene_type:complete
MRFNARIRARLKTQKLNILVFGPTPSIAGQPGKLGEIASKRVEIRDYLLAEGHNAVFPEDEIPKNSNDPITEEIFLIQDADLVVVIVESYGTNVEAGILSQRASYAEKTFVFIDSAHRSGAAYAACKLIQRLRGSMKPFIYPDDIEKCHLKTSIAKVVNETQYRKLYP